MLCRYDRGGICRASPIVAHKRRISARSDPMRAAASGFHVTYFDTGRDLPGMIEVIEKNATAEQGFQKMYDASQDLGRLGPPRASYRRGGPAACALALPRGLEPLFSP